MPEFYHILVINPGSTTTKLALFQNREEVKVLEISHPIEDLQRFSSIADQEDYRYQFLEDFIGSVGRNPDIHAVIGRGGLLHPLAGGVYCVNAPMLDDLKNARYGEHASNLGAILAARVARELSGASCRAFIADPVVVDEQLAEAKISGMPELERRSIFHALNQKSVARIVAAQLGHSYDELNFIVCHMGGGITVGAHRKGKVIDVNNGLDGEGPFSPERSGGLPVWPLVELALSGRYTRQELRKKIVGEGGVFAYMGSRDMIPFENQVKMGDEKSVLVHKAMALQISQEIAKHGATLEGRVDAVVLTGGLARDRILIEEIKRRTAFLAPVYIIPGERELEALADNALAALRGIHPVQEYVP